jgi:hypothetical protein
MKVVCCVEYFYISVIVDSGLDEAVLLDDSFTITLTITKVTLT